VAAFKHYSVETQIVGGELRVVATGHLWNGNIYVVHDQLIELPGQTEPEPITCCADPRHFTWDPEVVVGSRRQQRGAWTDKHGIPWELSADCKIVTPCCHRALLEDGKMTGPLVGLDMLEAESHTMGMIGSVALGRACARAMQNTWGLTKDDPIPTWNPPTQ
jgi:hypothetical protein